MDNQGFMPQGLSAAPVGRVAATARTAAASAETAAAQAAARAAAVRASHGEGAAGHAARGVMLGKNIRDANGKAAITAQEKRAERLGTWSNRFEMLLTWDGLGMLAAWALAGVAGWLKLSRVVTVIKAVAIAPITALRNSGTSLSGLLNLPATYMKEVSTVAADAGADSWAKSAALKAEQLSRNAASRETGLMNRTVGLREAASNRLEQLETTKAAKAAAKAARKVAAARLQRVSGKHERALAKAVQAATSEPVGFFGKIRNFFTGKKPAVDLAVPSELQALVSDLHSGKSLPSEARATHFTKLHGEFEALVSSKTLSGDVAERAGAMMAHVQKAASSAASMHGLESAAKGGLREMAGAAAKAVGRVPLFGSIVGVGVVLGIGAKAVEHSVNKAHTQAAYDDVVAMLDGKTDNAFMEGVRKAQRSDGHTGIAKTVFGVANEMGNAAWALIPGGGGGAMMAAQMAPAIGEMFIKDNSELNTIVTLRKVDAGELQLSDDDRLKAIKQLIAVLPSVAEHGGVYNRLNHAIALEMIAQKMDTKAMVQLLADEAKFNAFSTEVKTKLAEQANGVAANDSGAVAAAVPVAANDGAVQPAHAEAKAAHPASHVAANAQAHAHTATHGHHPAHLAAGTKITNSLNDNEVAQHAGTVEAAHKRAVGQN